MAERANQKFIFKVYISNH